MQSISWWKHCIDIHWRWWRLVCACALTISLSSAPTIVVYALATRAKRKSERWTERKKIFRMILLWLVALCVCERVYSIEPVYRCSCRFFVLGNKISFLLAFPDCITHHENVRRTRAYHRFGEGHFLYVNVCDRTHHIEQQLYQQSCLQYGPNENIFTNTYLCLWRKQTRMRMVVTLYEIHTHSYHLAIEWILFLS